jgi:hypothetical protein
MVERLTNGQPLTVATPDESDELDQEPVLSAR